MFLACIYLYARAMKASDFQPYLTPWLSTGCVFHRSTIPDGLLEARLRSQVTSHITSKHWKLAITFDQS